MTVAMTVARGRRMKRRDDPRVRRNEEEPTVVGGV
jgi:hypothetical protein